MRALKNTLQRSDQDCYNAATGEYGDQVAMGILDPTKVARSVLQPASSIAGLMIATEAEEPKEEKEPAMPGGGMDDMNYKIFHASLGPLVRRRGATVSDPGL